MRERERERERIVKCPLTVDNVAQMCFVKNYIVPNMYSTQNIMYLMIYLNSKTVTLFDN